MFNKNKFPPAESTQERIERLERNVNRLYILHLITVILFGMTIVNLVGRVNVLYGDILGLQQLMERVIDGLKEGNSILQEIVLELRLLQLCF